MYNDSYLSKKWETELNIQEEEEKPDVIVPVKHEIINICMCHKRE